jgi:hypothetical protein
MVALQSISSKRRCFFRMEGKLTLGQIHVQSLILGNDNRGCIYFDQDVIRANVPPMFPDPIMAIFKRRSFFPLFFDWFN